MPLVGDSMGDQAWARPRVRQVKVAKLKHMKGRPLAGEEFERMLAAIPHDLQKNDTEESIPLLPGFEAVLLETPEDQRTGWVFNPASLQELHGRKVRHGRPDAEWVGKVITRIGTAAGVVVIPANNAKGTKAKFASAHDLRRTCAQRLDDAGVPEEDIMRVMRHRQRETLRRHYAPGTVQKSASRIRMYLGTDGLESRGIEAAEST